MNFLKKKDYNVVEVALIGSTSMAVITGSFLVAISFFVAAVAWRIYSSN